MVDFVIDTILNRLMIVLLGSEALVMDLVTQLAYMLAL